MSATRLGPQSLYLGGLTSSASATARCEWRCRSRRDHFRRNGYGEARQRCSGVASGATGSVVWNNIMWMRGRLAGGAACAARPFELATYSAFWGRSKKKTSPR